MKIRHVIGVSRTGKLIKVLEWVEEDFDFDFLL